MAAVQQLWWPSQDFDVKVDDLHVQIADGNGGRRDGRRDERRDESKRYDRRQLVSKLVSCHAIYPRGGSRHDGQKQVNGDEQWEFLRRNTFGDLGNGTACFYQSSPDRYDLERSRC